MRTVHDTSMASRSARELLSISPKPYFRAIDPELHLGYRKGKKGGKWVVRYYVGNQAYKVETFATADDHTDADGVTVLNYRQAQHRARDLYLERMRQAQGIEGPVGPYTVAQAVEDYLQWMAEHRKSVVDTRHRATAHILPTLGNIECAKLTATQLRSWHRDLATARPLARTKPGAAQNYREINDDEETTRRRRASANRVFTILKAALNHAWREGKVGSDDAWRRVKNFPNADAARVRWLSRDEARRLINACEPDFRALVHGGLVTGARYGELIALKLSDYNPESGTVHVRESKSGKARHVVLNDEGIALFSNLTAGRTGEEFIFRRHDGNSWRASQQNRRFKAACERAKIEPPASFHVLRHTWASLAVMAGAPLMVVAHNLGHSDTRMVEKHYGHLAASYVADTIRATAPTFGGVEPSNVERLER